MEKKKLAGSIASLIKCQLCRKVYANDKKKIFNKEKSMSDELNSKSASCIQFFVIDFDFVQFIN